LDKSGVSVSLRSRPYDTSLHDKRTGRVRADSSKGRRPEAESKSLICGSRLVFLMLPHPAIYSPNWLETNTTYVPFLHGYDELTTVTNHRFSLTFHSKTTISTPFLVYFKPIFTRIFRSKPVSRIKIPNFLPIRQKIKLITYKSCTRAK